MNLNLNLNFDQPQLNMAVTTRQPNLDEGTEHNDGRRLISQYHINHLGKDEKLVSWFSLPEGTETNSALELYKRLLAVNNSRI